MGMSVGNGRGTSFRSRLGSRAVISEINVTPFVDVILVLLIIFMVTAPLLTSGVPINLPEADAQAIETETAPISVSIDHKGTVFVQDRQVSLPDLVPTLQSVAKKGQEERILIRGDKALDYGTILQVMAKINSAGFKNIGLISFSERGF